ncbi:hypothetical protein [Formosa algae]|uniref:Uncharacterized protein n=1 Tax=Formosa algae TaxID=225843 RepID=A0A9X0YI33_9FLAO|nr:hypothetical protein [Formosa algae]MBP1838751.1 hypothetical protein [Formosa algae]MDQ0335251.1 hypothetical protein [Formosa algae]OEI81684.1 hypothetical protein AST99_03100 [Formosa algae]
MKKKLESELINIALRIIRLEGKDDLDALHAETAILFEKLSVLKFLQESPEGEKLTIANDSSFFGMLDSAFNNKVSDSVEVDEHVFIREDQQQPNEDAEDISEPVMEKIKNLVAEMPQEDDAVDAFVEAISPEPIYEKNDFEEITADFKETPIFEPVSESSKVASKKSLNDKLKSGGLNIGLNDKIAFIKQLFGGSSEDYDRVISQVNTCSNYEEASHLIQNVVKVDYNNWEGKEIFETRFMQIIEDKFN